MKVEQERLNTGSQRILAWAGPISLLVFFVGFWPLARFIPPLHESLDAGQVATFFRDHSVGIRLNCLTIFTSCGLLGGFYAEISVQLKRIEGPFSPMAYAQIITGTLAVVPFIPGGVAWTIAALRPERSDELIYLMSDYGWIMFFMVGAPAMIQFVVVGIAVLGDDRAHPILPRWYGYFCFACALTGDVPGWLVAFFKTGPFSWNGLISFWIPAIIFGVWTQGTALVLLQAIAQQKRADLLQIEN